MDTQFEELSKFINNLWAEGCNIREEIKTRIAAQAPFGLYRLEALGDQRVRVFGPAPEDVRVLNKDDLYLFVSGLVSEPLGERVAVGVESTRLQAAADRLISSGAYKPL